jgi:hypothetical protein
LDKGFVEFFKKFMGVVKRITGNLIYGWGTVFIHGRGCAAYKGWWEYGGV